MIIASKEEKRRVVKILADAFSENKSVNFVVHPGRHREKRIEALMCYSFDVCFKFGEIYLSESKDACALILYPYTKKTTLLTVWWDLKLILKSIGILNIRKVAQKEKKVKQIREQIPQLYLWFIGVNSASQHNGSGTRLLNEIIALARNKQLPVYLETSTVKNISWYEKYGFSIYNAYEFPYTLYFMKKL